MRALLLLLLSLLVSSVYCPPPDPKVWKVLDIFSKGAKLEDFEYKCTSTPKEDGKQTLETYSVRLTQQKPKHKHIQDYDSYSEWPSYGFIQKNNPFASYPDRPPIILVPGVMGTQLEATIVNDADPDTKRCVTSGWKKNKKFHLWMTAWAFTYPSADYNDCFYELLSLKYNSVKKEFEPKLPGVSVEVDDSDYGLGGISQFTYKTLTYLPGTESIIYYRTMIEYLESNGWKRGVNLFGFGYDWRMVPQQKDLYAKFKARVEEAVNAANKAHSSTKHKAIIIAHSMGNLVTTSFLNRVNKLDDAQRKENEKELTWTQRNIAHYVGIQGPFYGTNRPFITLLQGHDLSVLDMRRLASVLKTFPSAYWLMPQPHYWGPNPLLKVEDTDKEYSMTQLAGLNADLESVIRDDELQLFTNSMQESVKTLVNKCYSDETRFPLVDYDTPYVPLTCISTLNIKTKNRWKILHEYSHESKSDADKCISGDSSVSAFSARACLLFGEDQAKAKCDFNYFEYSATTEGEDHVDHQKFIQYKKFLGHLTNYILSEIPQIAVNAKDDSSICRPKVAFPECQDEIRMEKVTGTSKYLKMLQ